MTDPQSPAPGDGSVPPPPPGYSTNPPPAPAYGQPPSYGQPPQEAYGQPQYAPAPQAPYGAPASATIPGRTMGIVAFILSFFVQLIALILGIVALVQSRKAGHKNGWALAAIIISAVLMVVGVILFFAIFIPLITFGTEAFQACQAVGFEGTVTVRGLPVECSDINR
ncbi:DUF4190 domain-containing protein [Microbacterium gallinarum]|jgi:hypothetical protein|uniref:DUF4190 domain-containing protein n=1 Tax=Microbacterium gallinarum TaxID=2762209 RepID=A0ABR8WYG3_9MICO|nr:DUF4190 domain-containing protein [Microbacterium gallinarum]MBD8022038.1 DUF4190 domain-containing protein [Microbacterium gallinarum]